MEGTEIPDTLPLAFSGEQAEQRPGRTEFFTPKRMGIITLILFGVLLTLWIGGAIADQETHKRVTGKDVGLLESMFNDLHTPEPGSPGN